MNPYNRIKEAETVDTVEREREREPIFIRQKNLFTRPHYGQATEQKNKIEWISVLRAFSCMAVVMIHVINIRI